jgi:hypothetical protein
MLNDRQRRSRSGRSAAPVGAATEGYALLTVVVMTAVLLTLAASTIQLTRTDLRSSADEAAHQQAFYIAEAGIQRGLAQLNWERSMASTYTTYAYSGSSQSFGNGSYVVSIAQDPQFSTDPTRKLITSTGTRGPQTAQVVAHAVVQPNSSAVPPGPTPTLGPNTTPTPGGNPTPTPPGAPPVVDPTAVATATAGPVPTSTPGVPPGMPTPTPTPSASVNFPPCNNQEILVSYNGTATLIDDVDALSNLVDGNGRIFSNNDVTFETVASVGANASGTGAILARNNFNNAGANLNLFSKFLNVSLSYGNSYVKAPLDSAVHLLVCNPPVSVCQGAHFGTVKPQHGTQTTIAKAYPWQPDYQQLKRFANVIVNKHYQPFGSWDSSSGTWVVSGYSFPAGTQTLYYVEGNVKLAAVSLFRTASPRIVARGWISMTSLTVLSTGLLSGDVQSMFLIGEKDVMIGRDVTSLVGPSWQSESATLALGTALSQGINLVNVDHTLNVIAYSQGGDVWGMVSNLSALSHPRLCFLANQDATLAFTGTLLTSVRPLN